MIQNKEPGLNCPVCSFFLKFSIDDLLYKNSFICPGCGLKINLNREDSRETINALQDLNVAIANLERSKKFQG